MVGFLQSTAQLRQVARTGGGVQLSLDQFSPGCAHGIDGSREYKDECSVGHPGQTATLQGTGSDGLKRQDSEQFAESLDRLVQKRDHRFRCAVPTGETRSARRDHDIHRWFGDPLADLRANLVAVVGTNRSFVNLMSCFGELVLQVITAGIVSRCATV